MSEIDTLIANNQTFAAAFDLADVPRRPVRGVAIVACMDARLDIDQILGVEIGDAHVIRNAGGVVTDDAIRSLLISQRLLGTSEVLLIHHTDCGMLSVSEDEVKAQVEAETGIRPTFALEAFDDLDEDVRQSITRVRSNPLIPHRDSVRGFVYDVQTGLLREVVPAGEGATHGVTAP